MPEQVVTTHVVGIDIGMESCTMSCLTMDKRQVIKATPFANTLQGFEWLFERLEGLGVAPKQMLMGLEATSRYGENLLQALLKRGYQVCLLHPAQMHVFAQQRGLRAKTDQLDAVTDAVEVRVVRAVAADDAVDVVTLVEQQLGKQGTVLPADAGDERTPFGHAAMIEAWNVRSPTSVARWLS